MVTANTEIVVPIGHKLEIVLARARQAGRSVLMCATAGAGKSEFVMEWAQKEGLRHTALDLSVLEPPDLTGLPMIENGRTRYAPPSLLPSEEDVKPQVLVLEELNRCDRSLRQPCLQLLTARRINNYTLPAGVFLVATINPNNGTYDVDELDEALLSRFLQLNVVNIKGTWLEWAENKGIHPAVLDFVREQPEPFSIVPPRSWTYLGQILNTLAPAELDDPTIAPALIHGCLGHTNPTHAFIGVLKQRREPLPAKEVILNYSKHREKFQNALAQGLTDKVANTARSVADHLIGLPNGQRIELLEKQHVYQNLSAFTSDLPGDLRPLVVNAVKGTEPNEKRRRQ